jgi:hypothetical protein
MGIQYFHGRERSAEKHRHFIVSAAFPVLSTPFLIVPSIMRPPAETDDSTLLLQRFLDFRRGQYFGLFPPLGYFISRSFVRHVTAKIGDYFPDF